MGGWTLNSWLQQLRTRIQSVQAPEAAPPDFEFGLYNLQLQTCGITGSSIAASPEQASSLYRSLTSIATELEPLEHAWLRHSPTANPPEPNWSEDRGRNLTIALRNEHLTIFDLDNLCGMIQP